MDTRMWGPSAWQLFHLVAFEYPRNADSMLTRRYEMFFNSFKQVLPCRFCRESTTEFMNEPDLDLHKAFPHVGRWSWKLHNRVNRKLREQHKKDSNVIDPGPDPSFESIQKRYQDLLAKKPTAIPGMDFLMSIAYNYPDKPTADHIQYHYDFFMTMYDVYPFKELRAKVQNYMDGKVLYDALQNRGALMRWMYGLLKSMSTRFPSYRSFLHRYAYYKSGCAKKTYRGKTCRRLPNGNYTKDRDHRVTHKVSHSVLL